MERIDELKAWLRFNTSSTDDYFGNSWTVSGNPSVAATNAEYGNALQLDGSSYVKIENFTFGGQDFTIDFWAYVNKSSTATGAKLISVVEESSGEEWFYIKKSSSTDLRIYAQKSSDRTSYSNYSISTVFNTFSHICITYNSSDGKIKFYRGGSSASALATIQHSRGAFTIKFGDGIVGALDEVRIYDGLMLWTASFTPPSSSEYDGAYYFFDAQRKIINSPLAWYYANPGRADLLTIPNGTTVTGLTAEQSITGVGFYQPDKAACFGISATKEIWIRCDVYTTSNYKTNDRLRIYSTDSSGTNGWATYTTITSNGDIWHNGNSKRCVNVSALGKNINHSVLLHMRSGSSDGLIEISLKNLTTGVVFTDTYTGNVNEGNDFANVYIQMDGVNIYVSNLIISNAELYFSDVVACPVFDAIRMPKIPATLWQYENAGTITDLINTNTAVQVNNPPQTQSKTGSAFYQTTENIALFDIATGTSEVWIKFDVYSQSYGWKIFDYTNYQSNSAIVVGILALCNYTPGTVIRFFNYDGNSYGIIADVSMSVEIDDTLRTFVLHMKADSTNGIIELFSDVDGLVYSFNGAVNGGIPFSKIDIVSGVDSGDADLFSNVVISNNPLWFDDNVSRNKVNFLVDAQRNISRSLTLLFDTERIVTESAITVNLSADTQREIAVSTTDMLDAERRLSKDFVFDLDTERIITGVVVQVSLLLDTERKVANVVTVHFDKEWGYFSGTELLLDTEREIEISVNFTVDILRKIPHRITDRPAPPPTPPEPTPGVVPPADKSAYLQSCTISLAEQQLTDNITFVFNGTCEIMDAVDFQLLDYALRGRVEETTTRGVMTTCKCTVDIDAVLYQQLAYSVPPNKWEYTEEYIDYVHSKGGCIRTDPGYEDSDLKAIPSAPASAHITEIAAKLGKNVSLHFTDFISTMSTDVKSGTNYAGLLQELFGWTSRLPHMMINCYLRGNTIYVVQRGQEQNTVTLDGQKLTVHTVNKKLVRTTWGSDPWSKTEVKPYFNDWTEGVKEPLPEEGGEGGTEYNDDGLVEETTVQHGDETVVTHYYYETLENGQKFLYQEVATTYNNGSKVDEVTTYHDPVRDTQSHVYSVDSDGVLGGVVTSSNNDDRRTPWQNAKSSFQGGILVSDMDGNRYLLKELIYHSDKGEMARRTINGVSLIDTSFPVEGESFLQALTNQIMWLDSRTEETVTVEVYDYPHLIDFNDKIIFGGNTYHLRSNTVTINEKIVNRQSLEFVRWY